VSAPDLETPGRTDGHYASAFNFVLHTFQQAGGPMPSHEAMERAAKKIAKVLRRWAKELMAVER